MAGETALRRFQAWQAARLQAQAAMTRMLCHDLRGLLSPGLLVAERLQSSADAGLRVAGDRVATMVALTTDRLRPDHDMAAELPAVTLETVTLGLLPMRVPSGLEVVFESPPGVAVRINLAGFAAAFAELAANSAAAGARVMQVSASVFGARLLILVRDDGPGLPQPSTRELFVAPSGPGDPIGLALARDLLRSMGGDVRAVADGPGAALELAVLLA